MLNHYCRAEKSKMMVGKDERCSWCDEPEPKTGIKAAVNLSSNNQEIRNISTPFVHIPVL